MMRWIRLSAAFLQLLLVFLLGQRTTPLLPEFPETIPPFPTAASLPEGQLTEQKWTIDGVERTALVYIPKSVAHATTRPSPPPVLFDFHGHGGNSRFASRAAYEKLWPEAVVIYPQGLPTKGMTDPQGRLPGWQQKAGDEGDRDLKFTDAMLASIKKDVPGGVDEKRIFVTGHSNGGRMTYLLWETRSKDFAAFAPSSSPATLSVSKYTPKPAMILGSPEDQIVPFAGQERSMTAVKKLDGTGETGQKWASTEGCEIFGATTPTPVITYIHHGGHTPPRDAPTLIVKFFKEVASPTIPN